MRTRRPSSRARGYGARAPAARGRAHGARSCKVSGLRRRRARRKPGLRPVAPIVLQLEGIDDARRACTRRRTRTRSSDAEWTGGLGADATMFSSWSGAKPGRSTISRRSVSCTFRRNVAIWACLTRRAALSLPADSGLNSAPARGPSAPASDAQPARPFFVPEPPPPLIFGAGPIVIGQACEFDYSGTQACKALKDEGYRIVLVNSNPGHDHDRSGSRRRHLYRADHARDRRQDHREGTRPDARSCPPWAGQTALNCALSLNKMGVLDKFDVEMIGATADAIDKAEDRELFREAMT